MRIQKKPRRKCIFAHSGATVYKSDSPSSEANSSQNLNFKSKNTNQEDCKKEEELDSQNTKVDNVSPIRIQK